MSETRVQTIQIVLPVHANHHGTTFGGQVKSHVHCYRVRTSAIFDSDYGMDDRHSYHLSSVSPSYCCMFFASIISFMCAGDCVVVGCILKALGLCCFGGLRMLERECSSSPLSTESSQTKGVLTTSKNTWNMLTLTKLSMST